MGQMPKAVPAALSSPHVRLLAALIAAATSTISDFSPPAPLVCADTEQPKPFVAVAWTRTCECTGNVSSADLPCDACYDGHVLANYACRAYSNIVELATLNGGISQPGSCGPAGYAVACRAIDFGTYANVSVACAMDQQDPACASVMPPDLTRPGGSVTQPVGEKFLLLEFVQDGQPILSHPADALPLTSGACPSTGNDNDPARPPVFTGVWWDYGIQAIANQAELFFPAYKQAGGKVDELIADWEASMWKPDSCPLPDNQTAAGLRATRACHACALDKWSAIERDPRFPDVLSKLQSSSYNFTLNGTLSNTMGRYQCVPSPDPAMRPEGMADCAQLDGVGEDQYNLMAWNAFIEHQQTDAWVRAILPAARKSFPKVRLSLYGAISGMLPQSSCSPRFLRD